MQRRLFLRPTCTLNAQLIHLQLLCRSSRCHQVHSIASHLRIVDSGITVLHSYSSAGVKAICLKYKSRKFHFELLQFFVVVVVVVFNLQWNANYLVIPKYQQLTLDNRSKCLDLTNVSFVFDLFHHFRHFARGYIAGRVCTLLLVLKTRISVLSLYRLGYFSVDRLK